MKKVLLILVLFLSCKQKEENSVTINLDTSYVLIDGHKVFLKIEQEVDGGYVNHKYAVHTKLWAVEDTTAVVGAQLQEWNVVFTPNKRLGITKKEEYNKVYKDAVQMLKNQ
jgi:hypothetical protein